MVLQAPKFYTGVDKDIYEGGITAMPLRQYRLHDYTATTGDDPKNDPVTNKGIVNTNAFIGNNQNSSYPVNSVSGLTKDFWNAVNSRQDRLRELNRPLREAQFPSFPSISNAQQAYNLSSDAIAQGFGDLIAKDNPDLKHYRGDHSVYKMQKDANELIQDHQDKARTGQFGPSYIPAEEPTWNRKIQEFFYSIPGIDKPQTAEMIMGEGWTGKAGGPGIIAALLGKMDKFHTLPRSDQAFIQSMMGYHGPTVFGENTSGGHKDPFGINVRSGFGNYADYVREQVPHLQAALERAKAKYTDEDGVFDEETYNKMTDMMQRKLAFYQKSKKDLDTFRADGKLIDTANKETARQAHKKATEDLADLTTDKEGGGKGIADPGYSPGGGLDASKMGGGSQQAQYGGQKAGGTGRTDKGWGWAQGGRVRFAEGGRSFKQGGLASIL